MATVGFGEERCGLANFDGQIGCQSTHFNLLFKIVPSISDESTQIVGTHFRTKIETLQVDPSQNGASFWGNDPEFILVVKNAFERYIICLKSFTKNHIFLDKL